MSGLRIDIARKTFARSADAPGKTVFENLHLEIAAGTFLCILGPSGCGKTTLLNLVAGLDGDFQGRIGWTGAAGSGAPKLGYVFQQPTLLPWRRIGENLRLVMSPAQIERKLDESYLAAMGLADYRDSYPKDLSLGMSRRVALARAFAVEPDLLLMDEPFVSLDEETAQSLRRLLMETWRRKPTTVLFVTHDSREALQLGQRIVMLGGTPARVVKDREISLSAGERADPLALETLRAELHGGKLRPC